MVDLNSMFRRSPVAQLVSNPVVPPAVKNKVSGPMSVSASAKKAEQKMSTLSIGQILKTTPRVFKDNSNNVVIRSLKKSKTRNGLYMGVQATAKDVFSKPGARTRTHKCSIVTMDAKQVAKSKSVYLSCTCEAFMFWCETALNKRGAAAIKFSNGEAPETRNPQSLPMMCKHLIALAYACKEHSI